MRHVEHRRPAVAAVCKEEAAGRFNLFVVPACPDADRQRNSRERAEDRGITCERRQRRVGLDDAMAEPLQPVDAGAIAASRWHRSTAGRHDVGDSVKRAGTGLDAPASRCLVECGDAGVETELDASAARGANERVAHVTRAVGHRKVLAGFALELEWHAQRLFEEPLLMLEWPRAQ